MVDDLAGAENSDAVPEEPPLDAEPGAYDAASDFAIDTQMQIGEACEALGAMPEIQPGNWDALPTEERLTALQNVEDTLAGIQQRPSVEVHGESMGAGTYGYFDGDRIAVNAEQLNGGAPVEEMVDTVVHEGRHAFQQYAIEHSGVVSDQAVVDAWAANMAPGGYLSVEDGFDPELYQSQPIEADAWSYAERIREAVYSV